MEKVKPGRLARGRDRDQCKQIGSGAKQSKEERYTGPAFCIVARARRNVVPLSTSTAIILSPLA